ncbi:MFS transporter [Phocaeicola massiliensis]|uniref:MFS transporter n=1 Tax=Phocaeicola massiliensis TaxID=204516 RepID=UPI0027E4B6FE|nr:MFS transporter [Phocaeicola massiliensis]MDQ7676976.1 MFS transporter [Phocaeicola massiliensis]
MAQKTKQWGAIIIMIALFAMIAFVTNLCTPMATIIKNQGPISNVLVQIGNYGNFIAYLVMGIPAGMLISKYGYKKTALIGLVVGSVGILIQWISGLMDVDNNLGLVFAVYLIGAFIAGLCMCILNCVVNPMLNLLGGGGNSDNQLIQIGGVFNSTAAVACYILMGALIGDAAKAKISDATPALMIALAIFVVAFIVISFTKIEEPKQAPVQLDLIKGAMSYRHFALGTLGIFVYMGIEVGVPNFVQQYLISDYGLPASTVGMIVAVYWFMMLIGRFVGASIGEKVSSRTMITVVSSATIILVLFGMFAPTITVAFPGVNWGTLEIIWEEIPLGIFSFLLVGLCTSVMWGAIFNMAVEGLGKYTAIASGIFMTMVFGCAVMMFIQATVADLVGYIQSFWCVVACAVYLLFYALIGSKVTRREAE